MLVGVSVAALTSPLPIPIAVGVALLSVIAAVALTLTHPYRTQMKAYAESIPSIAQLVPLMIWWLLLMLAPIITLPWWGVILVFLALFAVAYLVFPHVDGTRKLAFA